MTWFPPTEEQKAEVRRKYLEALHAGNIQTAYHIRKVNICVNYPPSFFNDLDREFVEGCSSLTVGI